MPFQMPITIAQALRGIQTHDYVLPAIQREFVWDTGQVARLFDSLLRGYPIGSFLFWKVEAKNADTFKFYGFIRDYHELTAPHCPVLDLPSGKAVTAILDGQQRLTALNLGLRGSYASRLPGKWRGNPANYPKQLLYLNVCAPATENELGMDHDFRFLTTPPPSNPEANVHWFPVHRIMDPDFGDAPNIFEYVQEQGLATNKRAFPTLERLRKVIHDDNLVNFYEEVDQDLDRVLDIFIRVNSGGTVLSYSDLLLSIATAQWNDLDAREEIHGLVDDLNDTGQQFAFSKDVVLKAGLVLTDVSDVGFKVTNFNHTNMARLEADWDAIAAALRLGTGLLADFGFSATTLTADSVLIPVSYYVFRRSLGDDYRIATKYDTDRATLRHWIIRTVIKPGVWGSGLDTLLRELRRVIAEQGTDGFPIGSLESTMAVRGKALTFSEEEIDDLVETPYSSKRVFPLLALLFPAVNTRNLHHVDHVWPRALFKRRSLLDAGVPPEEVDEFRSRMNGLPNLQLLEGTTNVEKQQAPPLAWASAKYGQALNQYLLSQELLALTPELRDFLGFYKERKERLRERLREALSLPVLS
jgi:Protein of unknown function DUF262